MVVVMVFAIRVVIMLAMGVNRVATAYAHVLHVFFIVGQGQYEN